MIIILYYINHILFSIDCTDGKMVYSGPRTNYIASDLAPVTRYSFHLQASTEGDDSPQSKVVSIITLESGKSEMSTISFLILAVCRQVLNIEM